MSTRLTKLTGRRFLLLLLGLLVLGFSLTSIASYLAAQSAIHTSIVRTELPLVADNVYSEVRRDLMAPILISSLMATDTFLRDWVQQGEQDVDAIQRYLAAIQQRYGTVTSFFISDPTRNYYHPNGIITRIEQSDPQAAWYFRVKSLAEPYEINVDHDTVNRDRLTIFVNYRAVDESGKFIGVAGVGLSVDAAVKLLDQYQQRYQRQVWFTDSSGRIMLTSAGGGPFGARSGQRMQDIPSFAPLFAQMPKVTPGGYTYQIEGAENFLKVSFISELEWYLMVNRNDQGALSGVRRSLYTNLAVFILVTIAVLVLAQWVVGRFQEHISALANTDLLTGLPNRRSFTLLANQALLEAGRDQVALSILMLDIDHFKQINDRYGHGVGDSVIAGVASALRENLRASDIFCRWGGEEFIVLLRDTSLSLALQLAEKVRLAIGALDIELGAHSLHATISAGVTELLHDEPLEALIARADAALYQAKAAGRNCVAPALITQPSAGEAHSASVDG
ncbi:sensor domain-containing diguanylate cyclase [Pseudomarimonas arenosa]|uniref:diguanylate cyclase n=1 Tax=Pseudomarimonas arenosa TaxID=2774145 RepID=A0AAW3ZND9_9GAMM|nr:sensor domain-containing diguanylate cyclase [Pseudomarimonas arenosa]MBD8526592.1 GGDEF domain-containing protein [Pseudomarimonas arenosa]